MVYFIADQVNNVVKIGCSKDVKKRLKQLQTSNSNVLVLLGYMDGNKVMERNLHSMFEKYRLNGEWFSIGNNDEIISYINENNLMFCFVDRIDGKVYRLNKMKI